MISLFYDNYTTHISNVTRSTLCVEQIDERVNKMHHRMLNQFVNAANFASHLYIQESEINKINVLWAIYDPFHFSDGKSATDNFKCFLKNFFFWIQFLMKYFDWLDYQFGWQNRFDVTKIPRSWIAKVVLCREKFV